MQAVLLDLLAAEKEIQMGDKRQNKWNDFFLCMYECDNHTCKEWNQKTEQQLGDTGKKDATKQASLQASEYIQDVS